MFTFQLILVILVNLFLFQVVSIQISQKFNQHFSFSFHLYCCFQHALEQDSSVFIKVQHALNPGNNPVYTERGNITIHSLRLKQAIVSQKPLSEIEKQQLQVNI